MRQQKSNINNNINTLKTARTAKHNKIELKDTEKYGKKLIKSLQQRKESKKEIITKKITKP